MALERFEFTKDWEDPTDFPTYESSEARVREDIQLLYDECRDKLNEVIDYINNTQATVLGDITNIDEKDGILQYSKDGGETWSATGPLFSDNMFDSFKHGNAVVLPGALVTEVHVSPEAPPMVSIQGFKGDTGDKGDTGTYYTTASAVLPAASWTDHLEWESSGGTTHEIDIDPTTEGYIQRVVVPGVTFDDLLLVGPQNHVFDYMGAEVFCSGQYDDSLVFQCSTTKPTVDIRVGIAVFLSSMGLENTAEVGA